MTGMERRRVPGADGGRGCPWPRWPGQGRPVPPGTPKKAVLISMLPKELPYLDRFKMAVDAGFAGIEMQTSPTPGGRRDPRRRPRGPGCASTR